VLETDSPDMPPVWVGHGRNSPGELPRIAQTLAELRGVPLARIADQTVINAIQVFGERLLDAPGA